MDSPRLEIDIYQIVEDSMLMKNRSDGTGWDWCWADWQRDWMNATPQRYAYRCLPLTIANQTGWWIKNPVGFTATWGGRTGPGTVDFQFDAATDLWKNWINSQFGEGIVTWNTPFLFRTRPKGSRLLICGPPNYFKTNAQPLTAIIESDWISMSFTMNWKLTTPGQPVRFEMGEPLFQAIPLISNICQDLEDSSVSYQRLSDNPELQSDYLEWTQGRRKFHEQKAAGEVKGSEWQKDYFQGRDAVGRETDTSHKTKIKPPTIRMVGSVAAAIAGGSQIDSGPAAKNLGRREEPEKARARAPQDATPNGPDRQPDHSGSPTGGNRQVIQEAVGSCPVTQRFEATSTTGVYLMDPNESKEQVKSHSAKESQVQNNVAVAHAAEPVSARQPQESAAELQMKDEWRRWIAENLMLGHPAEGIVRSMIAAGVPEAQALGEVNLALQSPYIRGSELLRNRLTKRDWLFSTYRKLNRLDPKSTAIERRHKLSRAEFLHEYYTTNRPVIITGMMEDWPAMRKWNLDFFAENFGAREVEVQMGRDSNANYETESGKFVRKIKFGDFIEKLRTSGETNDFYLTANNNSSNKKVLPELWQDIIQIPEYLTPEPNGGFAWMGPAGTITPFHHDLTNNFMAQVIGRKRLKIAPSWDTPLMSNHLHVFSKVDGRVVPPAPSPQLDEPQIQEFILSPGEVLFLPIGCWHYVQGLDISVTVSFTNFVFDNDFSSFYKTYGPV